MNPSQPFWTLRIGLCITCLCLAPGVMPAAENVSPQAGAAQDSAGPLVVQTPGLALQLDRQGRITGCTAGAGKVARAVTGGAELRGFSVIGSVIVKLVGAGGYEFTRRMQDSSHHACVLTDRFLPTRDSIRWEMEVVSDSAQPWTTPFLFRLKYPATPKTRFWTTWVNGSNWDEAAPTPGQPAASIADGTTWGDPLVPMPLMEKQWDYGNGKGTICIPVASMLEADSDSGLSLAVSPDQPLLWVLVATWPDGTMTFQHNLLRLGGGRRASWAADLVAHEADWRGGLRWMVARYPQFFNPSNPQADPMAGTASYAYRRGKLDPADVQRLKKMAYTCNWAATFDWPYYGMFLPPMADAEACWETSGHNSAGQRDPQRVTQMSWRKMNDECRFLREQGFFMLNYFCCTEFGSGIQGPEAVKKDLPESEVWRDATTYLYRKFPDAIFGSRPTFSWSGSVVMDPGVPSFQAFLVDQARRHAEQLPDSAGICIDRMDWLSGINFAPGADDGVGWYDSGKPGRYLGLGWKSLLSKLAAVMHPKGKVIFVNCCLRGHRIDLVRDVDGFYDEYGDLGYSLNGSSLLALRKPALMWTHDAAGIQPDADSYFQRHLHMGAYPTAPMPGNDHTITPAAKTDRYYLDYGPLLASMRGKKWVLEPHCVATTTPGIKVNLFQVPGGYVAPVTFGGKAESAVLRIRNVPGLSQARCEVLHPGAEAAQPIKSVLKDGVLELAVPLKRGCAMVRICVPS